MIKLYAPTEPLAPSGRQRAGRVEVVNASALAIASVLPNPVVLNFASGTNPGGGYKTGGAGQEEDLCRSSALGERLESKTCSPFYTENRAAGAYYTDWAIYTPAVAVVPDGQVAFITCAAPNRRRLGAEADDTRLRETFTRRIDRVLGIAEAHDHPSLVLGAWGCGVFRNDPQMAAEEFRAALDRFRGAFERIVFAVYDRSPDAHNFQTFRNVLR